MDELIIGEAHFDTHVDPGYYVAACLHRIATALEVIVAAAKADADRHA